jgi:hypothetical protein
VHVVEEQQKDPGSSAAEHAAKALMNAAACDAAKVRGWDSVLQALVGRQLQPAAEETPLEGAACSLAAAAHSSNCLLQVDSTRCSCNYHITAAFAMMPHCRVPSTGQVASRA